MTNTEMKAVLKNAGVAVEDIAKIQENYDVERISMIVEAASNPKSAFNAIHAFYPELEVEKLQEQMDFVQEQLQSDEKENQKEDIKKELYNIFVCGFFDSIKNFFQSNWKAVAVGAAIVVGAALIGTGVGAIIGAAAGAVIGAAVGAKSLRAI